MVTIWKSKGVVDIEQMERDLNHYFLIGVSIDDETDTIVLDQTKNPYSLNEIKAIKNLAKNLEEYYEARWRYDTVHSNLRK